LSNTNGMNGAHPVNTYDEVPYPSHAFAASHPDLLYTLAQLFKLPAALPDNASILELGCAGGGNVIPLALQMPNARVVGVDLSARQIAEGQEKIKALGLKNIKLLAQDFQSIDQSFGEFDYILCHGVFSWVPEAAQHRILDICNERLTQNGVAYISYNAYPGWFMRGMIRQMMLHHVAKIPDPLVKIAQARAFLAFMVASTEGQQTPYAAIMKSELDLLATQPDSYLFHDHLEENNRPLFFYQFMELAHARKLQFMSESHLPSMITGNLPAKAAEALTKLTSDIHHRSQYTDFVTNRTFRQTLLCRSGVVLDRNLDPARFESAFFAGTYRLKDPAQMNDMNPETDVAFETANKQTLTTRGVGFKALLYTLMEAWPKALSIPEIIARVEAKLAVVAATSGPVPMPPPRELAAHLLQMATRGDIETRLMPHRFTNVLSERPQVSALTRLECKSNPMVTSQKHSMVRLDDLTRLVASHLDGEKTKENLVALLEKLVAEGMLNVKGPSDRPTDMRQVHTATIDKMLEQLRLNALLTA
jgi:methyltransferase-like protein/ubiquinone/menaquinone biosynthesis C-methylase UbiE